MYSTFNEFIISWFR